MKAICPPGSSALFFSTQGVWKNLKNRIIPYIVLKQKEGSIIRVWVCNCSTGQWAYSLAIVFLEVISELRPDAGIRLSVLASDIDGERVEFAKNGLYPKRIADLNQAQGVSKERLKRFFDKTKNGYQVKPEVIKMLEFSVHDLVDDPPYKEISFLYCKYLLPWFSFDVKKKCISQFMESILPGGVLYLDDQAHYRRYFASPKIKSSYSHVKVSG